MDVALDGGEDDAAFSAVVGLLHELFEMGNRGFHCLGRLENEGELHLTSGEKLTHNFHPSEKNVIDDEERLQAFAHCSVEISLEVFALSVDDPLAENLFDCPITAVFADDISGLHVGEDVEKFREWVVALASAVIDEIE